MSKKRKTVNDRAIALVTLDAPIRGPAVITLRGEHPWPNKQELSIKYTRPSHAIRMAHRIAAQLGVGVKVRA